MGIWFGCLTAIAVLPLVRRVIPDAHVWLIFSSWFASRDAGWLHILPCRSTMRGTV